jgi:uncharacterized LabA/DUF88 family protein
MNAALFVDLPNFYSHLLSSEMEEPRLLRDYFLHWLDFDRLAEKLTGHPTSVWVFYSGRRFGPSRNRIKDEFLSAYITRINNLSGVTARDVNIPGEQREPATYHCQKCGSEGTALWESEKGIDTSLTVHLFDTAESWDVAYLLSGDADFVPAVSSLRRRGKIVIGAGFNNASTALVRECYQYIDLSYEFLLDDVLAFHLFNPDGALFHWTNIEVNPSEKYPSPSSQVKIMVEWQKRHVMLARGPLPSGEKFYQVNFTAEGSLDLSARIRYIDQLRAKFPNRFIAADPNGRNYQIAVNATNWSGIDRRIDSILPILKGEVSPGGLYADANCIAIYRYNDSARAYELASITE